MAKRKIEYNGQILTISAIAELEGISPNSLSKNHAKTQDIYEAVRLTKENQLSKIEYNGEMLTMSEIAELEGISPKTLRSKFKKTPDIYEAVKKSKEVQHVKIKYNGQILTIPEIAKLEGIPETTFRRNYDKTHDIYEAVKKSKEPQYNKIEYKGQLLTISEIAKSEGIPETTFRRNYDKTQDIYETVKISKEHKIEYNGQLLTITAIAKLVGISPITLKSKFEKTQDINKAAMLCKLITSRREGKKQIIHTDMYGDLSRYDLSVILGIRYTDFDRMLSEGKSIEEIIESKASKNNTGKASNRNARVRLENGQYLNEYCIEHKLNYACIYRLMKVYGKTLEEAEASYNKNGQAIPKTWIFEKYGLLLKHLMLKESIDVYKVVDHMRKDYLPMEQAVEKYIVRKNSKNAKIDPDWTEELYEVLTETTDKEEYKDYLQAFYVDKDEVNCINQSKEQADNFKRKLILFDIAESLENGWFPPEEEKDLFETYDVTEDEVDIIFKELYKRFNSYGVLMGKNQEEVLTPGQIEERDEKISKYKQIVRDIHEDKTIVSMMRFMVKYNVDTNEVYRDEIQGELRKEKDACQIDQ